MKTIKAIIKEEKGFNLMEVALAMALLGVVAITFLTALAGGSKAIIIADERATAESLARAQMEYVREQDYIDYSQDPHDVYDAINYPDDYTDADYAVVFSAAPIDPETYLPYDQTGGVFDQDDGIQKMTVVIHHTVGGETEQIFTLEGYRTFR